MKAMILAAGEGTRLRPLTYSVPKPMIPIVGRPLLSWTLSWLADQGVTEAIINLYHRPQAIPDFFGSEYAGIRLNYSFEEDLRGTAGGVQAVAHFFTEAPFFVIYGDNLIRADLREMTEFHAAHGGEATLALFHHPNPSAAGIVATDTSGRVTRFVEKPPPDQIFSDTANAGIYLLNPSVLDAISDIGAVDFGRDVFPALLAQNAALYGLPLNGYLQDTGTPDQYRQANWDALAGRVGNACAKTDLWIGPDTSVSPTAVFHGRNVIGSGAIIEDGATLTDCIVWNRAKVGSGVSLKNAIVGTDAVIAPDTLHAPGALIV
jgi:NDP-sugar pyrophosphorylase family protein